MRFKELADRKKEVYDEDLIALVRDHAAGEQRTGCKIKSPARRLRHRRPADAPIW